MGWAEGILASMPRVVEDQEALFNSSAFFTNLSRFHEVSLLLLTLLPVINRLQVRYTSIPHAPS